jgi:hypothetical protein
MRMALRPAVSLLQAASAEGASLPDQKALDDMLHSAPGQRAAVSTFLGFLKTHYLIELVARKTTSRKRSASRERLGTQLAALANSDRRDTQTLDQWTLTALRYFHGLSKGQAHDVAKTAVRVELPGGDELRVGQEAFWLPQPPRREAS